MTNVFTEEGWYQETKEHEDEHVGTLSKSNEAQVGFGRTHNYMLILLCGKQVPIYTGGDIPVLNNFVGQDVRIKGKSICCQVNGQDESEIWPGEIEVVRDRCIPGS